MENENGPWLGPDSIDFEGKKKIKRTNRKTRKLIIKDRQIT